MRVEIKKVSVWPTLLGTVVTVMGGLAFLGGCIAMLTPAFIGWIEQKFGQANVNMMGMPPGWNAWILAFGAMSSLVALLAVIAGTKLLKRQRQGVRLVMLWAVVKIVFALGSGILNAVMQREQWQSMAAQPQMQMGIGVLFSMFSGPMAIAGAVFGLLIAWALPVTSLVWVLRPKIRAEVRTWGTEPAEPPPGPPPLVPR